MPKTIAIISQDYDGCYSIMTDMGFKAEFYGNQRASWEEWRAKKWEEEGIDLDFCEMTARLRQEYHAYLTEITKEAAAVKVYVGSDRQSILTDTNNNNHHRNGSVFPALMELCRVRSTTDKPWQFEHLLLADPLIPGETPYLRKRGVALQNIHCKESQQGDINFCGPRGLTHSKRPLLLNQMWDAYRQNPDAAVLDFHFIDDRQDLIDDILTHITPDDLPPNMTLFVSKFDYFGYWIEKNPQAVQLCGSFVSNKIIPVVEHGNTLQAALNLPAEMTTDNSILNTSDALDTLKPEEEAALAMVSTTSSSSVPQSSLVCHLRFFATARPDARFFSLLDEGFKCHGIIHRQNLIF